MSDCSIRSRRCGSSAGAIAAAATIAARQVGEEPAHAAEGLGLRLVEEVGDPALDVVNLGGPQARRSRPSHRWSPEPPRPGDEHVAKVLDHEDEIRDRG